MDLLYLITFFDKIDKIDRGHSDTVSYRVLILLFLNLTGIMSELK